MTFAPTPVSRATVREALRSLDSSGLIEKTPGVAGGSFVRAVDHQTLGVTLGNSIENTLRFGNIGFDEVIRIRRMLEVPAARLAAKNRGEEDLARIRDFAERQKATTVEDPEIAELDTNLHVSIAEASDNRVLASFVGALHRVIRPALYVDITPPVGKQTVSQHLAIVRAIGTVTRTPPPRRWKITSTTWTSCPPPVRQTAPNAVSGSILTW